MGRGKDLSDFEMGQIDAFSVEGKSQRYIAGHIGRSQSAVQHYPQRGGGYSESRYTEGRPKVYSDRDRRDWTKSAVTSHQSVREIAREHVSRPSSSTVHRSLQQNPFVSYETNLKQPQLTQRHKDDRLAFAKDHMQWSAQSGAPWFLRMRRNLT